MNSSIDRHKSAPPPATPTESARYKLAQRYFIRSSLFAVQLFSTQSDLPSTHAISFSLEWLQDGRKGFETYTSTLGGYQPLYYTSTYCQPEKQAKTFTSLLQTQLTQIKRFLQK